MSCCPPAPEIVESKAAEHDVPSQDSEIAPGESLECYMARAENPSGLKDDLTATPADKIANTSIPVGATANIDVTFELTSGSTRTATNWTVTGALPSGVTLVGPTGKLSGTVAAVDHGKTFSLLIAAVDGVGEIDSRTFTFSPTLASKDDSIQLLLPLPGGIVRSPFGMRVHPITKVTGPHKGIDLVIPNRVIDDVIAAADGVCTTKSQPSGAGLYVVIDHRNAAGRLLCQTVYMHLEKFYVADGQKVAAGQKIGREGSTGASTGPHLHFELKLISDGVATHVDPVPYIRGAVSSVATPNANGTQGPTPPPSIANSSITSPETEARTNPCPAFGAGYPADPNQTTTPVPPAPPGGSPFEKAWFFTLSHEVGPHWMTTPPYSPGDSELDQGLKDTTEQRKKTGYVNRPGFPGGETKFGIAQGPNPSINVAGTDYAGAKGIGYNNYWLKGGAASPSQYETTKPKTAIMLFDMCYLHGGGNVRGSILPKANIASLDDVAGCRALNAAQLAFIGGIVAANPSRSIYQKGWTKRANELLAYALSI